jgi:hypothetical protein
MERAHLERGFAEIAQNITSFPDGTLMLCRSFNTSPAGIKGANRNGICIEHLGNFDLGGDGTNAAHRETIVRPNARLLQRFSLPCDTDHVVFNHWWDLNTGERTIGAGSTKSCPGTAFFGGNRVCGCSAALYALDWGRHGCCYSPRYRVARGSVPRGGERILAAGARRRQHHGCRPGVPDMRFGGGGI